MGQLALPMGLPLCLPFLPFTGAKTVGTRIAEGCEPHEAGDALEDDGWVQLGNGLYCTAYLSPEGDRVVKIGCGSGSRATIEAALAHPDNPHLPTIYGIVDLARDAYGDAYFAVECEPLEHLPDFDLDGASDGSRSFRDWAKAWSPLHLDLASCPESPMKDAIAALHDQFFSGSAFHRWDLHDGNIMVRPSDGALVLNDLIA